MPAPQPPSVAVIGAVKALGENIRAARLLRGISQQEIADQANTTRGTLGRIEGGDVNVGIGLYAAVMHALGIVENLPLAADIQNDRGLQVEVLGRVPDRAPRRDARKKNHLF